VKVAIVLGTRPEIIKMSPIVRILERKAYEYFIVHSGRHYFYNINKIFFEQLKLPEDIDRGSLSIEA
jgi:UDP-N-acetylglucosamine 2-epimerase (non-hydrolysing)